MSFTIVTSLVNINRENWPHYQRRWSEYKQYMQNILRMNVPMCIFVEEETVAFVQECRKNYPRTKINIISIQDYRLYDRVEDILSIQQDPNYRKMCVEDPCPEINIPWYDVVVNNKIDFLLRASKENPFATDYFFWLDAGYGHCKFIIPEGHIPDFSGYIRLASQGKIAVNNLKDAMTSEDPVQFFKDHQDFIDGGLVAGSRNAIERLHNLYYKLIEDTMQIGIIDDDQYFMAMTYAQNKDLVCPVRIPGWHYRKEIIMGHS